MLEETQRSVEGQALGESTPLELGPRVIKPSKYLKSPFEPPKNKSEESKDFKEYDAFKKQKKEANLRMVEPLIENVGPSWFIALEDMTVEWEQDHCDACLVMLQKEVLKWPQFYRQKIAIINSSLFDPNFIGGYMAILGQVPPSDALKRPKVAPKELVNPLHCEVLKQVKENKLSNLISIVNTGFGHWVTCIFDIIGMSITVIDSQYDKIKDQPGYRENQLRWLAFGFPFCLGAVDLIPEGQMGQPMKIKMAAEYPIQPDGSCCGIISAFVVENWLRTQRAPYPKNIDVPRLKRQWGCMLYKYSTVVD